MGNFNKINVNSFEKLYSSDLQEAQIEGASISSEHQEGADPNRYDDDNWETFSEKSFSTV